MPSPADDTSLEHGDADVDDIVRRGPAGAFAVAGVATLIVLAIFFAFYFFAYLPRGVVQ
ncbi:hypothetical protein [Variovorax guangxiensis]|uniref:hypothetical protein n=1 Tax=Variovorax guangxiensis TaxID=1775474 RepID=UPI00285B211C|nr:hypothetical protein [Variovorax guangxiensis]MDR6859514.1 hypothetical protein [Variovorax guangxiensis]